MNKVKKIRIVSRNSPLSLIQVRELIAAFPVFDYELNAFSSFGDNNKQISLMEGIAADFFTRELDAALLNGEADISIHSAKDLPYPLPAGLDLFCLTEAADKTDSLVSKDGLGLAALPVGARVGTSSKTRKEELLKLRPDLQVVSIRGTIEERIAQVDSGFVDALVVATCALHRLGLSHRAAESLPFKTHPLQGNLAVVGRKGDAEWKDFFSLRDVRKAYGKVTLVGFGPGNADLLTLGGEKALQHADVIFHDDLLDKEFLNRYTAEKIYVGKRKDKHSHHQDDINELLYQAAVSGKNVVRLKGGDPMIFAHGREEIDFLL
ncbi:MAG: hydroxymethylbilane synthase, partial [Bacteroidales bacterium 45-6]